VGVPTDVSKCKCKKAKNKNKEREAKRVNKKNEAGEERGGALSMDSSM
jgi:hypothetical protein